VRVDWKRLSLIILIYVSLTTLTWLMWFKFELPSAFAYTLFLLIGLSCLYFAAFKTQMVAK